MLTFIEFILAIRQILLDMRLEIYQRMIASLPVRRRRHSPYLCTQDGWQYDAGTPACFKGSINCSQFMERVRCTWPAEFKSFVQDDWRQHWSYFLVERVGIVTFAYGERYCPQHISHTQQRCYLGRIPLLCLASETTTAPNTSPAAAAADCGNASDNTWAATVAGAVEGSSLSSPRRAFDTQAVVEQHDFDLSHMMVPVTDPACLLDTWQDLLRRVVRRGVEHHNSNSNHNNHHNNQNNNNNNNNNAAAHDYGRKILVPPESALGVWMTQIRGHLDSPPPPSWRWHMVGEELTSMAEEKCLPLLGVLSNAQRRGIISRVIHLLHTRDMTLSQFLERSVPVERNGNVTER